MCGTKLQAGPLHLAVIVLTHMACTAAIVWLSL